ncbi:carboxypeptidase-like regulatory domain-containing protein [Peristeroidobacter agariperforans]|uniref:carboxypeptidase-like regulatory domain-containing protein n=1 Tax=Peristeroidobacter agariperforans TaxID=268404 RepID=UPI00101D3F5F|nr:carboxypeptidase-like regulatory domain-containing protein [Peristeroidobacter agariperforans]
MSSLRTGRRLSAAVVSTLLMATLAACGGGGGGGSSTPAPTPPTGNPNPNPTPPTPEPELSRVTLAGTVTDAPIANAVVTATIGDETFTATADANGVYSLEIAVDEDATGGFVTLSARGVGSQSYVEFTSLAGTFASLQSQAGDDGTLSNTENFATQITNVSTAQAVLLKEANGGNPIADEASLRTLSATLNSQEVLDLATAIKLYVDDSANYPMPDGETSLLALMSSSATREQFTDNAYNQDPTAFQSTQTAIVTDSSLTQPVSGDSLPAKLTVAMLSDAAEFSFNYFNRVNSYTFDADGTGTATAGSWNVDTTWAVNGSSVEISYGETVHVTSYEIVPECTEVSGQVQTDIASDGVKLTLLSDRVVAITETTQITYQPECELDPRTETTTVARTILEDDDFEQLGTDDLADSTQSIYVYVDGVGPTADIADLNADGSGRTWAFAKDFTWALDSSGRAVNVEFADGTVAQFRSLRTVDVVTTDLFYEITTADGRYIDAGASVYKDPELPLVFTQENVVGRFYQFGIGIEGSSDQRTKGFRLLFENDGTGAHEDDRIENDQLITQDGSNTPPFNFHWGIDGEDVVIQRTFDVANQQDHCVPGSSADCIVYDERRLVPLAVMDLPSGQHRAYWMEYRRTDFYGVNDNTLPSTLVRFYDSEVPAASPVVSGKASLFGEASARKLRFRGVSQR